MEDIRTLTPMTHPSLLHKNEFQHILELYSKNTQIIDRGLARFSTTALSCGIYLGNTSLSHRYFRKKVQNQAR
jgi:hypothetical protein